MQNEDGFSCRGSHSLPMLQALCYSLNATLLGDLVKKSRTRTHQHLIKGMPTLGRDAKDGPPQIDADSPVERLQLAETGPRPASHQDTHRPDSSKLLGVAILGVSCQEWGIHDCLRCCAAEDSPTEYISTNPDPSQYRSTSSAHNPRRCSHARLFSPEHQSSTHPAPAP